MKIIIERKKLLDSIVKVHAIVEKRNIMPILEHVKIDINSNSIFFTTTDLDVTVRDSFHINYEGEISFTVAVQPLYDITKKLNNNDILEFNLAEVENGRIEISAGQGKITIPCLNSYEFPSFEILTDYSSFEIGNSDLRRLLLKTKHAMASGEMRYYLNGINLKTENDLLISAATDVHRLAMSSVTKPDDLFIPEGFIIPKKTVNEIIKLTESLKDEDKVTINISENRISLQIHNTILISKLIHGKYPNYSSIFAIQPDRRISVDVKELANAVELVSAIADGKIKIVTIHVNNHSLIVSADSSKDGKHSTAQQEINVESTFFKNDIPEEPISFMLNAKYLLDVLSISIGPRIHLNISTPTAPVIIKDMADSDSTYVLMPMQLENT